MISTELANLADWVLGFPFRYEQMGPDAYGHLAHVLMDLSRQAKQLERLPCDDPALVLNDCCND